MTRSGMGGAGLAVAARFCFARNGPSLTFASAATLAMRMEPRGRIGVFRSVTLKPWQRALAGELLVRRATAQKRRYPISAWPVRPNRRTGGVMWRDRFAGPHFPKPCTWRKTTRVRLLAPDGTSSTRRYGQPQRHRRWMRRHRQKPQNYKSNLPYYTGMRKRRCAEPSRYTKGVRKPKLLVAVSLLLVPCASAADPKHKQPTAQPQKRKFVAFAYSSGLLTSEGERPVAGKTVAADPRVLPMGSRIRISGAGPWSGEYRVGDKGSRIKGSKIDLYVSSKAEAIEFGRRDVEITVLEIPKASVAHEGTRARKAEPQVAGCSGCSSNRSKAIMNVDEAPGSNTTPASSSVEARRAGSGPGSSYPRQSGNSAAFVGLPAVQRPLTN